MKWKKCATCACGTLMNMIREVAGATAGKVKVVCKTNVKEQVVEKNS